ncbi:36419_t:CDS:2, partial [Gigaspora margarita]
MATKTSYTSYYRIADSGLNSSNRDGEKDDERDRSEGDNQPKPQFKDDCFRKMDLMIEFYRDNPKRFGIMAKQCADLSTSDTVLYDNHNESNPIQFSKLSDEKL